MELIRNSPELVYVAVLFGLFVIPRFLQRFRLPAAVTCFLIGGLFGAGFGWFRADATVRLLSLLGIVSLFLFAGLEVNLRELKVSRRIIIQHVTVFFLAVAGVSFLVQRIFALEFRPATLVSLALLTPSTGFILDSLPSLGLSHREAFWVKGKAISTEIVALVLMFVTLQSTTWVWFLFSALALGAMIFLLPFLFRLFATKLAPYAPSSEFAFLLIMALLCAFITRKLGVYYLVGAFVVGLAARRYRQQLPSKLSDRMMHAVEAFASFFIPFYFFGAGLEIRAADIDFAAVVLGLFFLLTAVPLRVGLVILHRKLALGESFSQGSRVAMPIVPTLVFTLVLTEILRNRFDAPPILCGGLILYTLLNTLLPSQLLRTPPPDFENPEMDEPVG